MAANAPIYLPAVLCYNYVQWFLSVEPRNVAGLATPAEAAARLAMQPGAGYCSLTWLKVKGHKEVAMTDKPMAKGRLISNEVLQKYLNAQPDIIYRAMAGPGGVVEVTGTQLPEDVQQQPEQNQNKGD
jgi:hypothetical protein